jgi:hypothetical protein
MRLIFLDLTGTRSDYKILSGQYGLKYFVEAARLGEIFTGLFVTGIQVFYRNY